MVVNTAPILLILTASTLRLYKYVPSAHRHKSSTHLVKLSCDSREYIIMMTELSLVIVSVTFAMALATSPYP